jgi:hypothetical protein
MPEQLPENRGPKKWEEMTLEDKVEDLNQRLHGISNMPRRILVILVGTPLLMLFIGAGAVLGAVLVFWLTNYDGKSWAGALPGMAVGIIGGFAGLLVFVALFRPWLRKEWEASGRSPQKTQT